MNPISQISFSQIPKISGQVPHQTPGNIVNSEMISPERIQSKKMKNYSFLPQCMQEEFESQDRLNE